MRRITFFTSLRASVLQDPYLEAKLTVLRKSPGLPEWWIPGTHDIALVKGYVLFHQVVFIHHRATKYGVFANRQINILFDPELPFREIAESKANQLGISLSKIDPYQNDIIAVS
jgi:hypothetical protein